MNDIRGALWGKWEDGRTWAILSALRGPDDGDMQKKAHYTAPIRLWLLGRDGYLMGSFYPVVESVNPLTEKLANNLWVKASALGKGDHYFSHIARALVAIADIEGWTVGEPVHDDDKQDDGPRDPMD